ncbi:MAG TPA: HAD-IA family hydrolase [Dissulfurispiraceae bacterium]|nr:HAD-IA family hydrolase [Dissulfurispiraceae bacterium]
MSCKIDNRLESGPVTTLFLDVGGVLLTNGWDRSMRKKAAELYKLDHDEMNERHQMTFDTYEQGKLSLDTYLDRIIFYEQRNFSRDEFKEFMFSQSKPFQEMIDLICSLKGRYKIRTAAVSNEGRELTQYRIEKFGLRNFIDFFVASCFVHVRKPDEDIFRIAQDLCDAAPEEVLYIDDRAMFVEVAEGLGFHGLHHRGYESTKAALAGYGLTL